MAGELEKILAVIKAVRSPVTLAERQLHQLLADALGAQGIDCLREARLSSGCRIDLLCGEVGIEIKRGRPAPAALLRQAQRYLASPLLQALIIVSERSFPLPAAIQGKPCVQINLQALWGIALPQADKAAQAPASAANDTAAYPAAPLSIDRLTHPAAASIAPVRHLPPCPQVPIAYDPQHIPAYLADPLPAKHAYGTLSYNARRKHWVIKAEPTVIELAKRLFPGCDTGKRGSASFSAHRRIIGELNWLLLRYPLDIAPADLMRWRSALNEARAWAQRRDAAFDALPHINLTQSGFHGTLRPFQQTGLDWLCFTPRALLADEMGLGKTVQCLASLCALGAFPCMLVVPPHLMLNWQREALRFVTINGRPPVIHMLQGLTPYPLPAADIYLVHYLLLRGWKEYLSQAHFSAVVFDEIQELRHNGTEKYSAASLLAEGGERVMGLSGTPIYNQGGEIWNVVNILDYHFLGDWDSFSREWCYGYGNAVVIKPDVLGAHLRREGLMLRRTKQDVLPELPAKRRLVQQIDADSQLFRRLMAHVWQALQKWRETSLTPSERALLEGQISQGERQATGLAKAAYVGQFVRALIESGEKVLLFAHHHAVMDAYAHDLKGLSPAFITGRETIQQKEKAVERFMAGRTNLCCISLRAASGLNLQRASCVVFGELDWSPAIHSQAEDRAHRIGQADSLLCYYLVSPEGSDADIQSALGLKVSQFLGLMGDAPESSEHARQDAHFARSHVEALVSRWAAQLDQNNQTYV